MFESQAAVPSSGWLGGIVLVLICTFLYDFCMTRISVSEARAQIRTLLERVERGEEITLTQHGRPVAVIIHPSQLRARRASAAFDAADRLGEDLEKARTEKRKIKPSISPHLAEELVRELRADRKHR